MLAKEDNELITNTNAGTPMGELFRRYWLPVALSQELAGPDCPPVRVRVLGEDLIAFRDSNGKPGLVDAFCPHRGAPMFFGRNEEEGLRCVYHGWKFDVTGACVDLPNSPEGDTYKNTVEIRAYPCEDKGDLIWAYMGPKEKKPPFPEFEWTKLPRANRYVTKFVEQCNYLQAMEGDYDPSHARFLHSTLTPVTAERGSILEAGSQQNIFYSNVESDEPFPRAVGNRRVKNMDASLPNQRGAGLAAKLIDKDHAMLSAQVMERPDGKIEASVNATWWMPIFCTAGISFPGHFSSNMRIPIDNESLMFYRLRWSFEEITDDQLAEYKNGGYSHPELIPGTWMPKANLQNDYLIDRVAQKNLTYSGIKTFPLQDIALIEAQWGPIAKREYEHLVRADYMIIHVRQRLLKAAKDIQAGLDPEGPFHPELYRFHRESAIGDTEEQAIANAIEKAMAPQLPVKMPALAAQ
jgi:phenylpropionate dioxygenase-like ring-hydroxylating dioxygenase large terminal subunit